MTFSDFKIARQRNRDSFIDLANQINSAFYFNQSVLASILFQAIRVDKIKTANIETKIIERRTYSKTFHKVLTSTKPQCMCMTCFAVSKCTIFFFTFIFIFQEYRIILGKGSLTLHLTKYKNNTSVDLEVQLVQLNHCDGVYSNCLLYTSPSPRDS